MSLPITPPRNQGTVGRNIQKLHRFLEKYCKSFNEKSLTQQQIKEIRILVAFTNIRGTDLQKTSLYYILLRTRALLLEKNKTEQRRPIIQLTDFFKAECPLIANQLEQKVITEGTRLINQQQLR